MVSFPEFYCQKVMGSLVFGNKDLKMFLNSDWKILKIFAQC